MHLGVLHLQGEFLSHAYLDLPPNHNAIFAVIAGCVDQCFGAHGFNLDLDDFGTGHSSLAYLKRLPVHTLKVDKSFVTDMDADEDNASIVLATIDLAHSLGLSVTAEGVETRAVYEMLWEMGCDCYQGYYVSAPLDMAIIADWLGNGHVARQVN